MAIEERESCAHVIESSNSVQIHILIFRNEKIFERSLCVDSNQFYYSPMKRLIINAEEVDLAIIKCAVNDIPVQQTKYCISTMEQGTQVFVLGYPFMDVEDSLHYQQEEMKATVFRSSASMYSLPQCQVMKSKMSKKITLLD